MLHANMSLQASPELLLALYVGSVERRHGALEESGRQVGVAGAPAGAHRDLPGAPAATARGEVVDVFRQVNRNRAETISHRSKRAIRLSARHGAKQPNE